MDITIKLVNLVKSKKEILRWLMAGLAFMAIGVFFMFIFVGILQINNYYATFLSAELSTILRYFVNNYWVFRRKTFGIKGLINYHIANLGAFIVWWSVSNLLINYGLNYIYATIAAVAFSTGISILTNFFWIWRKVKM